MKPGVIN